jgi:hypothetical protein
MLTLEDLFLADSGYLKTIADFCIAELRKLDLGDDDWIRRGAGPEAKNYACWNITPEGLEFMFDAYQVAPYAAGRQEIDIPYPALKRVLKPGGPLAAFFK